MGNNCESYPIPCGGKNHFICSTFAEIYQVIQSKKKTNTKQFEKWIKHKNALDSCMTLLMQIKIELFVDLLSTKFSDMNVENFSDPVDLDELAINFLKHDDLRQKIDFNGVNEMWISLLRIVLYV